MIRYATYCKLKALTALNSQTTVCMEVDKILAEDAPQEAGEGWRFLAPDEPFKARDEYWAEDDWHEVFYEDKFCLRRRRVEQPPKAEPLTFGAAFAAAWPKPAEPQYRLLRVHQAIEHGDQQCVKQPEWLSAEEFVGCFVAPAHAGKFRRPINKENTK